MEMIIESIDLGPRACFLDTYIIVRDGHSLSSNVLGHYCGDDSKPRNISSSGNKMLVEINRSWRSLSSDFASQDSPGFKARYVARWLSDGGGYKFVLLSNGMNSTVAHIGHQYNFFQFKSTTQIFYYKNPSCKSRAIYNSDFHYKNPSCKSRAIYNSDFHYKNPSCKSRAIYNSDFYHENPSCTI